MSLASRAINLECIGLSKSFGGAKVLDECSFKISGPRVVGLVGPNGAGKTTLIDVVSGFLIADSGQCLLNGREIQASKPHAVVRRGLARTFQEIRMASQATAIENVLLCYPGQRGESILAALFRAGRSRREERVLACMAADLMERMRIEREKDKLAANLSFGQKKLVSVSCGIATGAEVLLLDEPLAGVQPATREHVLSIIACLGEAKLVIVVEHDLDAVRRVAEEVLVLDSGRVVAQGLPNEVLKGGHALDIYIA